MLGPATTWRCVGKNCVTTRVTQFSSGVSRTTMASSSSPVVFGEPYDGALVVLVVTGLALALGAVARSWSGGRHSRRVLVAGPALTSVTLPAAAHSAWKGEYISDSVVEQGLKTKEAPDQIQCFDPATGYMLGTVPAMTPAQVVESVKRGRSAQAEWAHTSFDERAQVLQVIYQYLLDHQEEVARVAARDSGKTRTFSPRVLVCCCS